METILSNKLVSYLEENTISLKASNTVYVTNVPVSPTNWTFAMIDSTFTKAVDIIYLDFRKTFDNVPHKCLQSKLNTHSITGKIHSWLKNWLSKRKQRVVIDGKATDWRNVLSGVSQGSVLGHVLFIIYVNDMDEGFTCKIFKFADDTKITGRVTTTAEKALLQSGLDHLDNWSKKGSRWSITLISVKFCLLGVTIIAQTFK